jgi:ribose transport system substrate-binding protein
MKRALFSAAVLALALAGCSNSQQSGGTPSGGPPSSTSGGSAAAPNRKWVIGMSQCTLSEPWRVQMNADIKAAAEEHPNELEVVFSEAQDKSEMQQSQCREFIQRKVDLIIISPKEARPLTKPVEEAVEAGIPVIVLDRKIEGDKYTCFIGADNVKIGREAGAYLNKLLGGKGNVVEIKGLMTSTPAQDRHNGFMEGIQGSAIKIIFDPDCQWKQDIAQREMASALARFPQIDAVYGHNDPSAYGAYQAVKQEGKGREKTIKFIGIDSLPHEGIRFVKDGVLTATFQYPTGGKEAIETALKILKKEPFEKNITLGTRSFTKDTVDKGGEAL